jgi:signal peptide peptidase SppA
MSDVHQQSGVPFALEPLWAMEPAAFERLRDLVMGSSHERLEAAAGPSTDAAGPGYQVHAGVAVIPFAGVVTKRATVWSRIFGGRAVTTETAQAVNAAVADPAVKSILMVIDSPGGTVDGTAHLADTVHAANKVKPVTAFAEDRAASAAYWVGSQAGKFVGNSTAAVGSIGVFSTIPDISRLAKNMGIEVNVVKSVSAKGAGTMGAPVTDSQIAEMQRLVDATHALFVGAVSRGRGKDMTAVGDGRVHIGQAAVDLGLLDGIASLDSVLAGMQAAAVEPTPIPVTIVSSAEAPKEEHMETPTPSTPAVTAEQFAELTATMKAQAAKIAALEATKDTESVLAQAVADRKLTPALMPVARTIATHGGIEGLKAYVASLAPTAVSGGSVAETVAAAGTALPDAPSVHDHVGGSLSAFKPERGPVHQLAIAYQEKALAAGKGVSYRDAVIATTRKTA